MSSQGVIRSRKIALSRRGDACWIGYVTREITSFIPSFGGNRGTDAVGVITPELQANLVYPESSTIVANEVKPWMPS